MKNFNLPGREWVEKNCYKDVYMFIGDEYLDWLGECLMTWHMFRNACKIVALCEIKFSFNGYFLNYDVLKIQNFVEKSHYSPFLTLRLAWKMIADCSGYCIL